ncbi:hypothetical protein PVAP13_8KG120906 [Panicum virgatum]|uniref:Uncharacterized protein n=1 Tax=Panicum virgatum TaxID=38727 RepID=A0A8T0PMG2_PANVG|nr:hypothetical protein PVAP13_8KG120906 [Panicum virgatum]
MVLCAAIVCHISGAPWMTTYHIADHRDDHWPEEPYTLMTTLNMRARRTASSSMHVRRYIRLCMCVCVDYLEMTRRLARNCWLYGIFISAKNSSDGWRLSIGFFIDGSRVFR